MTRTCIFESPVGTITLESDGAAITGLWIEGQRNVAVEACPSSAKSKAEGKAGHESKDNARNEDNQKASTSPTDAVLVQACNWLGIYFSGKEPPFMPPVHLKGTPFQLEVWRILQEIPYGTTATYGDIAKEVAKRMGKAKMSAQAVGGAVGSNPVSIIVPCHRVIGAHGRLTGYQGGIHLKTALLELEGLDTTLYR